MDTFLSVYKKDVFPHGEPTVPEDCKKSFFKALGFRDAEISAMSSHSVPLGHLLALAKSRRPQLPDPKYTQFASETSIHLREIFNSMSLSDRAPRAKSSIELELQLRNSEGFTR